MPPDEVPASPMSEVSRLMSWSGVPFANGLIVLDCTDGPPAGASGSPPGSVKFSTRMSSSRPKRLHSVHTRAWNSVVPLPSMNRKPEDHISACDATPSRSSVLCVATCPSIT